MTDVIAKVVIPTSAYLHQEKLEPGKTYFWRVRAVEPAFSDWSAIGTFTTIEKTTPKVAQPLPPPQPVAPPWIWLTIFLTGIIWWLLIILLFRYRR